MNPQNMSDSETELPPDGMEEPQWRKSEPDEDFDFDYKEYPSEDQLAKGQGLTPNYTSYFGFNLDMTLDGDGDVILPDETLTEATMQQSLSTVGPVVDSFKHAFIQFEAVNKRLAQIELLSQYIHLRLIDLSDNRLKDVTALKPITYLQVLNLERNHISDVNLLPPWQYLQALNLARNEIPSTQGFRPNTLAYLNLMRNRINDVESFKDDIFPNLLVLELRENGLTSFEGISLPKLERLYVAGNQLESLGALHNCPNLKLIHARYNKIITLTDFSSLKKLEYLNLRGNYINSMIEIQGLENAPNLTELILLENPVGEADNYSVEVIAACPPSLRKLDKEILMTTVQAEGFALKKARTMKLNQSETELLINDLSITS